MLKLRVSLLKLAFGCAIGGVLFTSGCHRSPKAIVLSSGTPNGYYSRLAGQISSAADRTVNLEVENRKSQGSIENLNRLLDRQVDFALVQLDVVSDVMRQGKLKRWQFWQTNRFTSSPSKMPKYDRSLT